MVIAIRTLILYTFVVVILRLMGKRQIAQLQPFELVIILMISELAAVPSQDLGIPLANGIIPILVLLVAEEFLSYITLKNDKVRGLVCGKPTIVINKGKINENELRRMRYNLSDLLEQLRAKDAPNIKDIEYAILETNGDLSVILKSDKRPLIPQDMKIKPPYEGLPYTLISDGRLYPDDLKKANVDRNWLEKELKKANIGQIKDVFLATVDSSKNLFVQRKEKGR